MLEIKSPEIKFTIQAVRQAALLVQEIQAELVTGSLTKDDRSPVTVADFASQALVGHLLSQAFPNDPLVAEEDSSSLQLPQAAQSMEQVTHYVSRLTNRVDSQTVRQWIDHQRVDSAARFWTLDPIDGTKGFLRGDQYAVALALVIEGKVEISALGCPNLSDGCLPDFSGLGSLVIAVRNQGTWTTSLATPGAYKRLEVSTQSDPVHARLLRSVESGHTNVGQIDTLAQNLGVQAEPVRMDSQAKYAVLAAGKGELLLRLLSPNKPEYREKIWDQAAGSLILEEAGGRISDIAGKELDFTTGRMLTRNRGILASNSRLHSVFLDALRDMEA